ncbi:hypothetical protein AVEN_80463-1 [Araneus ventricosus]|uniref:Uncharacterized protein n=1 Tax=Araneus ventricosus TaxID=182803 RepID=A0A4Y2P2N7_ARAVE|nr:hypothetical protein AVEN_80463-1 [Araneus ventricosus]
MDSVTFDEFSRIFDVLRVLKSKKAAGFDSDSSPSTIAVEHITTQTGNAAHGSKVGPALVTCPSHVVSRRQAWPTAISTIRTRFTKK